MFGPILNGDRVRLAPVAEEMLPAFVGWFADPEITRFLTLRFPPSPTMEREWFDRTARSAEDIVWAVFAGERLIGTTGIHRIDWPNRRALTGNLIGEKTEWNKGYGSEVVRLRTRFAFTEMGLEKLTTKVFTENVGSRRALEKAGYRQCGLARRDEWRHGKWHDMWLAEVLRDEWASGAAAAAG
jgi:RimJ/RimL family protein N-acetyltransferase